MLKKANVYLNCAYMYCNPAFRSIIVQNLNWLVQTMDTLITSQIHQYNTHLSKSDMKNQVYQCLNKTKTVLIYIT